MNKLKIEQWRTILDYEGIYEVSNQGQVRSLDRIDYRGRQLKGKILKSYINKDGYKLIVLCKNGNPISYRVHRLALLTFIGICPDDMIGMHQDDNPGNNHLNNLKWGTHKENTEQIIKRNRHNPNPSFGEMNGQSKLIESDIIMIRKLYVPHDRKYGTRSLARQYEVGRTTIQNIIHRITWKHIK